MAHEASPTLRAWVFFTDKEEPADATEMQGRLERTRRALTQHAQWRRSKTMGSAVVDAADLPVSERYLAAVEATGVKVRVVSRWLNAVSVEASRTQLRELQALGFVQSLDLVQRAVNLEGRLGEAETPARLWNPRVSPLSAQLPAVPALLDSTQYSVAWKQLNQVQIPCLHNQSYTGQGVLVCILDSGFYTQHNAFNFSGHAVKIAARRDFIQRDTIVENEPLKGDQTGQDSHGTYILGLLGGWYPGQFIGSAPDARFMLGKTEWVPTETPVEMDYYQQGVEWADSMGADVISSSLAYDDFDPAGVGGPDITYAMKNGRTSVVSRAAGFAARRGIVLVTAMGNGGQAPYPGNKMPCPADADSIVSVGAVDSTGTLAPYSSTGPTADYRIKPDVVARGTRAWTVSRGTNTSYFGTGSGTSFSTPIVAGAVACLLSKHPGYTPWDVVHVLHQSASHPASPDTLTGWGLLRICDAANAAVISVDSGGVSRGNGGALVSISPNRPNPFRSGTSIEFAVQGTGRPLPLRLAIFDITGRLVRVLAEGTYSVGSHQASWNALDGQGHPVSSGVYFYRLESGGQSVTRRMLLAR